MTISKEEFFKPGKLSARDKASVTDKTAKNIIAVEAAHVASKTERLRLLRMARDAEAVEPAAAPPARATKVARARG